MSKLKFVTAKEFKERINDNDSEQVGLRKQFTIAKMDDISTNGSSRLKFAITTPDIDRDNDTIRVEGWDFADYKKNPVVLWAHDYYQPPVAKALSIYNAGHQIESEAEFTSKDLYEFGHMIYRMLKESFLNAVSVGFIPKEYQLSNDRDFGLDITKQSLLEYSVLPVPSNPNALSLARAKGIDIAPMKSWAEKVLDDWDREGAGLLLPRDVIEDMRKQADNKTTVPGSEIDKTEGENKSIEKAAISYGQAHSEGTPVSSKDTEWNGPEQIAAASVDDLKIMSTWVDSENPDIKGSYKLPHHLASDDHAVVWRGVTAAMGALLGARGGVDIPESDRRGVYNHLAEHYKEFEEEAPEFKYVEAQVLKHLKDEFIFVKGKLEKMTDEKRLEIDKDDVIQDMEACKKVAKTEQVKAAIDQAIAAFNKSFEVESGNDDPVLTLKDEPRVTKDTVTVDENFLNDLKETARDVIRKARGKLD